MPGASKTEQTDEELESKDAALKDADAALEDDDELDDEDEPGEGEDVPATAAGKASAQRLVDLMVEKKALALHGKPGKDLIEAVARALEWPGPVAQRAGKLSNAIVDSEDVDELFIDDETLAELLKRW